MVRFPAGPSYVLSLNFWHYCLTHAKSAITLDRGGDTDRPLSRRRQMPCLGAHSVGRGATVPAQSLFRLRETSLQRSLKTAGPGAADL
jgi:hypothetical protein